MASCTSLVGCLLFPACQAWSACCCPKLAVGYHTPGCQHHKQDLQSLNCTHHVSQQKNLSDCEQWHTQGQVLPTAGILADAVARTFKLLLLCASSVRHSCPDSQPLQGQETCCGTDRGTAWRSPSGQLLLLPSWCETVFCTVEFARHPCLLDTSAAPPLDCRSGSS